MPFTSPFLDDSSPLLDSLNSSGWLQDRFEWFFTQDYPTSFLSFPTIRAVGAELTMVLLLRSFSSIFAYAVLPVSHVSLQPLGCLLPSSIRIIMRNHWWFLRLQKSSSQSSLPTSQPGVVLSVMPERSASDTCEAASPTTFLTLTSICKYAS